MDMIVDEELLASTRSKSRRNTGDEKTYQHFKMELHNLLQQMSGGMKVALYTTLSGLISSILLSLQYKHLEEKLLVCFSGCRSLQNELLYLRYLNI